MDHVSARVLAIEHALCSGDPEASAAAVAVFFGPVGRDYTFSEWLSAFGHLKAGIRIADRLAAAVSGVARGELLSVQAAMLRQLGKLSEATERAREAVAVLDDGRRPASEAEQAARAGAQMNLGNIYYQARRYREAMESYNRTIELLRRPRPRSGALLSQLAAALQNRGNCLTNRGYLERGLTDYCRSIEIYQRLMHQGHDEVRRDLLTALACRADAHADGRDYPKAFRQIDRVIAELLALIRSGREELWPQLINVRISRGGALTDSGRPEEALAEFDQVLPWLEKLVASGRKELEPLRGLVFMGRALARVTARQHTAARPDAGRAVEVFQGLLDKGHLDVSGWLAHSLLIRAEAAYPEEAVASATDRQRGVELARQRIDELDNLRMGGILCRRLVSLAILMLPLRPKDAVDVLDGALAEIERILRLSDPPTIMKIEAREAISRLKTVEGELRAAGWDTSRLRHLSELTLPPMLRIIRRWWT